MKIAYGFLGLVLVLFLIMCAAIVYGIGIVRGHEAIEQQCIDKGYFSPRKDVIIQCRRIPYERRLTQLKGAYHGKERSS